MLSKFPKRGSKLLNCLTILALLVSKIYGKQAKIGKIDESWQEFLIRGSKVARNVRLEARQLLAKLLRFSKI